MSTALKPTPPSLPETAVDFLAQRKLKADRTLNDQVEDIHIRMYEDKQYRGFLYAVYDEQAVEGSLACDNVKAAEMIRNYARKNDFVEVADQKLATITKVLGVVLRRYGSSRKERRNMIGGEVITGDNGD